MKLVLFTAPNTSLLYDVKIETYNQKAKKNNRELIYKANVEKIKDTFSGSIVTFKRSDLLLDNTNIHTSIDEIVLIFGKLFEDINFEISQFGEILKIHNLKDIKEKWEVELKYKVSKTYKGILVDSMIENIDRKIADEKLFIKSLYRDPFFFSYIMSINGEYQNDKLGCRRIIDSFGGIKNIEANYSFQLKDNGSSGRNITGYAFLTDTEKMRLIDENKLNNVDYLYNSNYQLDTKRNINSISISQSIIIDDELSMKQKMVTKLI